MITDLGDKKLTTENDDYWIAPDANIIGSVHPVSYTHLTLPTKA